jgi:hypothetical protein
MAVGIDEPGLDMSAPVGAGSGPAGNERLTAATAVALILMLAIEGVTIVFLRQLLSVSLLSRRAAHSAGGAQAG